MKNKRVFLKLPEFPGGKQEFKKYIKKNLKYPPKALQNKVSGSVIVQAEINDNGKVLSAKVLKELGYGCDEEAIRLIKNIQFGGVKNRGKRVRINKKFVINFELPQKTNIEYTVVKSKKEINTPKTKTYSYKIRRN